MTSERRPVSRRERPAKSPLSREAIVDAAMSVIVSDGIDRLTMRRLATELDTGPASLYVYVRNLTELHAHLIDRLIAELDVSWDPSGDWRTRLRTVLTDYVEVLVAHPGLARSALVVWPDGPHYLDLVELVLTLLMAGGVPKTNAAWGVDLLLQYATAAAAEWSTRGEDDEQAEGDIADSLSHADPARHPLVAEFGPTVMVGGEPGERLAWFLEVLITGIAMTPREDASDL